MRTLSGRVFCTIRATSPNTTGYAQCMEPDVSHAMTISPMFSSKCEGMMKPDASKRLLGGQKREFSSPTHTELMKSCNASRQLVTRSCAVPRMSRPHSLSPRILRTSNSPWRLASSTILPSFSDSSGVMGSPPSPFIWWSSMACGCSSASLSNSCNTCGYDMPLNFSSNRILILAGKSMNLRSGSSSSIRPLTT